MNNKWRSVLVTLAGLTWPMAQAQQQPSILTSHSVEFVRTSQRIDATSPDGKAVLSLLPPISHDADSRIVISAKGKKVSLGHLERSAKAFWRPDSGMIAISDYTYSNHFFVRLINVTPNLSEVRNTDETIKAHVLNEFHPAKLVHYWPQIQGWTENGHLLVVVCADGTPFHASPDSALLGFARGYLIDPTKPTVLSELSPDAYTKLISKDPCQ